MTHCYKYNNAPKKLKQFYITIDKFLFHVPIFFLMSFYFSQKTIVSQNYKKKL